LTLAEAGRHLAIAGCCAVSRANPDGGRFFYPVRDSVLSSFQLDGDAAGVREFRVRARCISFDAKRGRAEGEAVLRTLRGAPVTTLRAGYHVVPDEAFRHLYSAHERALDEALAPVSPFARGLRFSQMRFDGQHIEGVLDELPTDLCRGIFRGSHASRWRSWGNTQRSWSGKP
jgi:hypothetical protein